MIGVVTCNATIVTSLGSYRCPREQALSDDGGNREVIALPTPIANEYSEWLSSIGWYLDPISGRWLCPFCADEALSA